MTPGAEARSPSSSRTPPSGSAVAIGILWGDYPWDAPPPKVGKLYSMGAVARNVTRALGMFGRVVPYVPRAGDATVAARRAHLADFLRSIDVLWADAYPASRPALELRHEMDLACPVLLFAGGAIPKGAEALLFPWQTLLRPGDALLFTCEADRTIWRRLVRSSRLHEWVIPLAVDQTTFRPRTAQERRLTREKHGLPGDAPVLLYVGRLNLQKNLHSLLRLLAVVRSDTPDVHLCIVGEEDDIGLHEFGALNTGYVGWLRGLAEDLGLTASISYLGTLVGDDLAQVYAAADVVVNASFYHRENFGLAQAEGQACGTPVVCTSWGGFKDVVIDGETGYLIDAVLTKQGVRVDWATGAQRVLSLLHDPGLRQRMGERASALAQRRFSIEAMSRDLSGAVASLLAGPAERSPGPAYAPSRFAARYEAHKRACGWYADADPGGPSPRSWYPRMYQGRDYQLYERLIEPYATRLSSDLAPGRIRADWIPYWSSGAALEPVRHRISNDDPVWPHRAFLRPVEWKVARSIDGHTSVGEIQKLAIADGWTTDGSMVGMVLRYLYMEGFVLFCGPVAPGERPDG